MFLRSSDNLLLVISDLQITVGEVRRHRNWSAGVIAFKIGKWGSSCLAWVDLTFSKLHRQAVTFGLLCLFVAVVSVHDAAMVVVNHQVIGEVEQNPFGRWLLELNGGDVWLFVFVKLATTAFVCAVLISCFQFRRRLAMCLVRGLSAFQLALLGYLTAF